MQPDFGKLQLPERLRESVERVHGETGRKWLATLPALLSECCARWSLELEQPFENLSYNLALPGRIAGDGEIVLKLGVPCRELLTEAAALSLFDGSGAVRLLEHDAPRGILLMERMVPGTPLSCLQKDAEATRIAASLMRSLWHTPPAGHAFPSLATWFGAFERLRNKFDGGTGPFPPALIANAEQTFKQLNSAPDGNVVLHGDLHHTNIIFSAERGWVAIDPKGILGEPGYDIGPFMLNRLPAGAPASETLEILKRRLSIFADELAIKRERLAHWAFCHAVLSAVWDFEDSAEWQDTIHLAQMLKRLG
jgi:streptomycin 6-kinase